MSRPAWSIDTLGDSPFTPDPEPDRLTFAATIWNAGPATLVVDGFRRPDEAVMDSYQKFFDREGNQIGSAPAGAMEWHPAQEHNHWHFKDFAGYRLLDSGPGARTVTAPPYGLVNSDPSAPARRVGKPGHAAARATGMRGLLLPR